MPFVLSPESLPETPPKTEATEDEIRLKHANLKMSRLTGTSNVMTVNCTVRLKCHLSFLFCPDQMDRRRNYTKITAKRSKRREFLILPALTDGITKVSDYILELPLIIII